MESLKHKLEQHFANQLVECEFNRGEVTIYIEAEQIIPVCKVLRDEFAFNQLIDLCGVDYSAYGNSGWETKQATEHGFSRAREPFSQIDQVDEAFATPWFIICYQCSITIDCV